MRTPDGLFVILQNECASAGIPVLSEAWANVEYEILIVIVGGKRKKKPSAFFPYVLQGNCPDGLSLGLELSAASTSSNPSGVRLARNRRTHTCIHAHPCAHSPSVWSTTSYYWLTCLNSRSSKSHSNSVFFLFFFCSILLSEEKRITWQSFLPNIPRVPRRRTDMFVAFLFVAWETMLACLLTFYTWLHPLNP